MLAAGNFAAVGSTSQNAHFCYYFYNYQLLNATFLTIHVFWLLISLICIGFKFFSKCYYKKNLIHCYICGSPREGRSSRNLQAMRRLIPISVSNVAEIGLNSNILSQTLPASLPIIVHFNATLCLYNRNKTRHRCAFCSVLGQKNAFRR